MMNAGNLKGKTRQTSDWRRRMIAFVSALTLLISSCGLTAFAESDEDIYSDPVTAPIPAANTSPEPEEGEAEATPAPEGQPETGTEPQETTGEETETEGEPEVSEEPEDLTVYEPGTLTAEADGVGITVDYTAEARVPEGAVLTLTRAAGGDLYSALKSASKVLKTEENATWKRELGEDAVFYAITLTNPEGNEVHPETGVTLTCTNLEIPADATGFVTGDNAENLDWKDTLTVGFLPDAIGYAYLKQVQIGTVTLTHEDRDYMVTAAYGPDAGFPAGTELKVREILPGTPEYALYSGMTDEALNEDWAEITLERYFDIAFVANGEELEPKADVDVQIVFRDKIEQNEETEVAAVHIENNEANVIEADTDSTKSARHDDEAIDTVTFTSDSFSVYGVVQKKKIITKVLAADGNTYEIEISYTQEAEIPEESQVKVEEIPEGSDLWEAYRKQTAAALNADDVRLPGLYDISIIDAEGAKIEPKAPVSVSIKLANAEANNEDLHVVHFTEEIPQELVEAEAKSEEQTEVQPIAEEDKIESENIKANVEGDTVTFDTQGFSVYAFAYKIVTYYKTATGETYKITLNYDENSGIPEGAELQVEELQPETERYEEYLAKTAEALNKDASQITNVHFFDIEIIKDGEKIEPTKPVEVTINYVDPLEMTDESTLQVVHFGDNGTEIISEYTINDDNTKIVYYQDSFSVTATVITSTNLYNGEGIKRALIVNYEADSENYYIVKYDGTLERVSYNPQTNKVIIDSPVLWTYEKASDGKTYIKYVSNAYHYTYQQVGDKFLYAYLDPKASNGISIDTIEWEVRDGIRQGKDGTLIDRKSQIVLDDQHHLRNDDFYFILINEQSDGTLKIAGNNYYWSDSNQGRYSSAKFYLAEVDALSEVQSGECKNTHTVNHIDISIEGEAEVQIPLAFGTYYNQEKQPILSVKTPKKLTLTEQVAVKHADMEKAVITAYVKDSNGKPVYLDDMYYITGYSSNTKTPNAPDQVRIEGSFKVANLPYAEDGWNLDKWGQKRLDNRVYYTVTATKPVTFVLEDPDVGVLCDENGKPLEVTVDVSLSATFNYFDFDNNKCPPLQPTWGDGTDNSEWKKGNIPYHGGSGMDFELKGVTTASDPNLLAIEITKYIEDEQGNLITLGSDQPPVVNEFIVLYKDTQDESGVQNLGSESYDLSDYSELKTKKTRITSVGMSIIHDTDVSAGMYSIQEKEDSIPETIKDSSGKVWEYKETQIETEYVWRYDSQYNGQYHTSKAYKKNSDASYIAIPEVLGEYSTDLKNGLLEFFVHNVYQRKATIKTEKFWEDAAGVPLKEGEYPEDPIIVKLYRFIKDNDKFVWVEDKQLTKENGWSYEWTGLDPDGYYKVVESFPTEGVDSFFAPEYLFNGEKFPEEGIQQGTIQIVNKKKDLQVKLRKCAAGTETKTRLEGAKFKIYKFENYPDGVPEVFDDNSELTSDQDGVFYKGYLPIGKYVMVETSAPEHYQLMDPIEFELLDTPYVSGGKEYYLQYRTYKTENVDQWRHKAVDGEGYFNLFAENIPLIDVPVEKSWSSEIENGDYYWSATFKLKQIEVHHEGPTVDNSIDTWTDLDKTINIYKGQAEEERKFTDLPLYHVYPNGAVYRIKYAVTETAYEIREHNVNGTIKHQWNESGLLKGDKFTPYYKHVAGELDSTVLDTDDEKYYSIIVENNKDTTIRNEYIDITIDKHWDGISSPADDSYARFVLKRFVQKAYKSTGYDVNTQYTVTLQGFGTYTFSKNSKIYVVVETKENQAYQGSNIYKDDQYVGRIENGSTPDKAKLVCDNPITVDGAITVRFDNSSFIDTAYLTNLRPDPAGAIEDTEWNTNHAISILLNNSEGWSKTITNLPQLSVGASSVDTETYYSYTYYLEEVESNPSGYYVTMTDTNASGDSMGNKSHRIDSTATVYALNKTYVPLKVEKEWFSIEDPDSYPEIRFSLCQGLIQGTDEVQEGSVFVDSNGRRYENIPLNSENNWTWTCPVYLPEEDAQGRAVGYYVVENTDSDKRVLVYQNSTIDANGFIVANGAGASVNNNTNGTSRLRVIDYYNKQNSRHARVNSQELPKGWEGGIAGNTGTLMILNRAPKYMQMDIKKKVLIMRPDGSVDTIMDNQDFQKSIVLEIQLTRRIFRLDGTEITTNWENYGKPFMIGFDSNGEAIQRNPNNFVLVKRGGFYWEIVDVAKDAGEFDYPDQSIGLPAYGYYNTGSEIIPVKYKYIPFEIGMYSDFNYSPYIDDEWFIGFQPAAWSADGRQDNYFPKLGDNHDQDRIKNVQGTDLYIEKTWKGSTSDIQEIYVKIYYSEGENGARKDFTELIYNRTGLFNRYNFVSSNNLSNYQGGSIVIRPTDGSVHVHYLPQYIDENKSRNHYWIEEIGYKDVDGVIHDSVAEYTPSYYRWDGEKWIEQASNDSRRIVLGSKGNNSLRVENKNASLIITKSFSGEGMTDEQKDNVTFTVKASDGSKLLNGSTEVDSLSKNYSEFEDGSWKLTFKDGIIPGKKYTVTETNADIPKYTRTTTVTVNGELFEATETTDESDDTKKIITGEVIVDEESYTGTIAFTNEYEREKTHRHVVKVWDDSENHYSLRPESITFTLIAKVDSKPLEEPDLIREGIIKLSQPISQTMESPDWVKLDWLDLPVYTKAGEPIEYSFEEGAIDNYTLTLETYDEETLTWTMTNKPVMTSVTLEGSKTMKGGEAPVDGVYSFTLSAVKGTPMPTGSIDGETDSTITVHNNGKEFSFGSIAYLLSDMAGATQVTGEGNENKTQKTFTYTVIEVNSLKSGIIYDPAVYTVAITVTYDSEAGTLTASAPVYSKTVNDTITTEGITEISFENEELTEVNVEKLWKQSDGTTAATPPEGTKIVLNLYKGSVDAANLCSSITLNGIPEVSETPVEGQEVFADGNTANAYEHSAWHAKWINLPKYQDGQLIEYLITEASELSGYTVLYSNDGTATYASNGGTITNKVNEIDIDIIKVDDSDEPKPLAGAEFMLEKCIGTDSSGNDVYEVVDEYKKITVVGDGVEKGKAHLVKLINGKYRLTETKAPDGYNLLSLPLIFTVEGGAIKDHGADGTTIKYEQKKDDPATPDTYIIKNTPGVELPSTGGSGTLIYTIAGMLLITLAGALLAARKRKANR